MALGPGKYDDICTKIREETEADAVAVIVISGNKGNGFSVQCNGKTIMDIPEILEALARTIRRDVGQ